MRRSAWKMELLKNKNRADGFLIILLIILIPIFLKQDLTGPERTEMNDKEEWNVLKNELTAFNKLTLGIPISINSESEEGLTAIPGVGEALARAIVNERNKRGTFSCLDDLKSVPGIGERLFEKILPYVRI